jgi:hypothetical protein
MRINNFSKNTFFAFILFTTIYTKYVDSTNEKFTILSKTDDTNKIEDKNNADNILYLNLNITNSQECRQTCIGCCINNECVSDTECKILFFSSFGILICVFLFTGCGIISSLFYIIFFLIKIAADSRKKYFKIEDKNILQTTFSLNN